MGSTLFTRPKSLEALTRVYDSYHNLGGNDVATELFHRTISLPTDPEKEDA